MSAGGGHFLAGEAIARFAIPAGANKVTKVPETVVARVQNLTE